MEKWILKIGGLAGLALVLGLAACDNVDEFDDLGDGGTDTDADTDGDTDTDVDMEFDGIDMLVMIDDSASMNQEQATLAGSMYALVSALVSPLPTSPYAAVDELRVAVVTSNMGFSSDGNNNDSYWPSDVPASCEGFGDNGEFQQIAAATVELANDAIPCDGTAAQCPPGWSCAGAEADAGVDAIGVCHTNGATAVACPDMPGAWGETSPIDPEPALATEVACLAQQGTTGCGWEQQLASVSTALARSDQEAFLHATHLLAILAITDEDDCSMQDGAGLFGEDEVADPSALKVNIACGEHPERLFPTAHFYDRFVAAKAPGAVVFAAITGVPYAAEDPTGAAACEGWGDEIYDCLEQDAMQLVPEQTMAPDNDTWYFHPACTRSVDATEVTHAYPARRFVELANESFGNMSYVYSICNADWSPAFEDIKNRLRQYMTL